MKKIAEVVVHAVFGTLAMAFAAGGLVGYTLGAAVSGAAAGLYDDIVGKKDASDETETETEGTETEETEE